MLGLKKIAVTGGLSSGKSTVCKIFESLGAYYLSADDLVHQLLSPKTELGKKIVDLLGSEILSGDQFKRATIAEIVFSQKDKLEALEQLIHPAVINEIKNQYQKIKKQSKYSLFVAEIPLLYESAMEKFFDAVIAVVADLEICKKRFQSQTPLNREEEFERRMSRQMDMKQKAAQASYIITNNGTLIDLKKKATKLYKLIEGT